MKNFTEEQINQTIDEVQHEVAQSMHQDFCEAAQQIPEEYKNFPITYSEVALAIAQRNSVTILKEVLCKLLID